MTPHCKSNSNVGLSPISYSSNVHLLLFINLINCEYLVFEQDCSWNDKTVLIKNSLFIKFKFEVEPRLIVLIRWCMLPILRSDHLKAKNWSKVYNFDLDFLFLLDYYSSPPKQYQYCISEFDIHFIGQKSHNKIEIQWPFIARLNFSNKNSNILVFYLT